MLLPAASLLGLLFILLRLTGLLASSQVLGGQLVPWRVRIALALAVSFLLAAVVPPVRVPDGVVMLLLAGAAEVLLGLAVGLTAALFFHGVRMAGQVAGIQMGLGFSSLVDPASGDRTTVLARLLGLAAWMVVLGCDGHLVLLRGLADSFSWLPPGSACGALGRVVVGVPAAAGELFVTAVVVAAPALVVVLLLNVGMALLARAAPQLHILVIGFIITIVVGVSTVAFSLGGLAGQFRDGYLHMADMALSLCRPA